MSKLQKQNASLKKTKNFRKKFPTHLKIFCTYISFKNIVATHRNNMSPHIVNHFCGTHNLKLWPPHIGTTCVPHIGKQTHIDTFCGTYNLKLWPPHIDTTCVADIGNGHTLIFFLAHITSNCGRHTQRQHVCHTQKNRVYMWPHIQYWYYMSVTICGHIQYHFRLIIYLMLIAHEANK